MIGVLASWLWPRASAGAGLLFMGLAMLMGLVGGGLAVLIRTHLSAGGEEGLMLPETYLSVVTLHGSVMVFGVAMPALFAGIGCIVLPRLLGRERLVWHPLLVMAFWLLALAQLILLSSLFLEGGAAGAGWTSLPPLSVLEAAAWDGQDFWVLGMGLCCVVYGLVSLVYVRTCCCLEGVQSLFVHAYRFAAGLGLLSFPVMLVGLCLLTGDRHAGTSFFMPGDMTINNEVLSYAGGLPYLFRTLFWHLGHPSMLILSLPALGVLFEISTAHMGEPPAGRRTTLLAMLAMLLSTLVLWGLRLFEALSAPYVPETPSPLALVGVACLLIIGVNLALGLARPGLRMSLAMHFVVASLVALFCAALGGLWLGVQVTSERLHGSYFAVGHLHLLLGLVSLLAIFAAVHHWFPKLTGKSLDEGLGRLHFWLTFGAFLGVFLLMQFQGFSGLLRRYWDHNQYEFAALGQQLTPIIGGLTYLGAGAQALFLLNLVSSMWLGDEAQKDPE